ncbi:MAG: hypothetical protein JXR91_02810 [Deltaproteobacteria bacterium]|nr:hypothetical protein [Deltaproteobacteria bacterium]
MRVLNSTIKTILSIIPFVIFTACWDTPMHVYDDDGFTPSDTNATDADTVTVDSDTDDSDTADSETADSETDNDVNNSLLSAEWQGFGTACTDVSDCDGYPSNEKRCITQVMGLIKSPGGYCTACCNEENRKDACGPGIDCVGANNAYLVCLARCKTDADCRTDDNYECRSIYYLDSVLTDKYCMPDEAHMTPDPSDTNEMTCPWPWVK